MYLVVCKGIGNVATDLTAGSSHSPDVTMVFINICRAGSDQIAFRILKCEYSFINSISESLRARQS